MVEYLVKSTFNTSTKEVSIEDSKKKKKKKKYNKKKKKKKKKKKTMSKYKLS